MTCILKTCAHNKTTRCASLAKAGLGECGAAYALDLAKRNDGYLVFARDNATIDALRQSGLIITTDIGDGYLIARAVRPEPAKYLYRRDARSARAAEIGGVL